MCLAHNSARVHARQTREFSGLFNRCDTTKPCTIHFSILCICACRTHMNAHARGFSWKLMITFCWHKRLVAGARLCFQLLYMRVALYSRGSTTHRSTFIYCPQRMCHRFGSSTGWFRHAHINHVTHNDNNDDDSDDDEYRTCSSAAEPVSMETPTTRYPQNITAHQTPTQRPSRPPRLVARNVRGRLMDGISINTNCLIEFNLLHFENVTR